STVSTDKVGLISLPNVFFYGALTGLSRLFNQHSVNKLAGAIIGRGRRSVNRLRRQASNAQKKGIKVRKNQQSVLADSRQRRAYWIWSAENPFWARYR